MYMSCLKESQILRYLSLESNSSLWHTRDANCHWLSSPFMARSAKGSLWRNSRTGLKLTPPEPQWEALTSLPLLHEMSIKLIISDRRILGFVLHFHTVSVVLVHMKGNGERESWMRLPIWQVQQGHWHYKFQHPLLPMRFKHKPWSN